MLRNKPDGTELMPEEPVRPVATQCVMFHNLSWKHSIWGQVSLLKLNNGAYHNLFVWDRVSCLWVPGHWLVPKSDLILATSSTDQTEKQWPICKARQSHCIWKGCFEFENWSTPHIYAQAKGHITKPESSSAESLSGFPICHCAL